MFQFSNSLKSALNTQQRDDIDEINANQWRVTAIAIGIFIGMFFIYLPAFLPALPFWLMISIKLLGSTTVIGAGFLYGGLIARLCRSVKWNNTSTLIPLMATAAAIAAVTLAFFSACVVLSPYALFILMSVLPGVLLAVKRNFS